jgi:hypothetical protein
VRRPLPLHSVKFLVNIVEGRRTAQERVTGGRWRRIVLGDVLAEHVVELRGRARVTLAVGVAGVLAAATAGYAIGEGRTSPWLEAIAGIRQRPCPRLGSKPVPAPRTRYEVRCGLRRGFSPAVSRLKHQLLPSASKCVRGSVCAGQSESGSLGVNTSGSGFLMSFL